MRDTRDGEPALELEHGTANNSMTVCKIHPLSVLLIASFFVCCTALETMGHLNLEAVQIGIGDEGWPQVLGENGVVASMVLRSGNLQLDWAILLFFL